METNIVLYCGAVLISLVLLLALVEECVSYAPPDTTKLVYEWTSLRFDWDPSLTEREEQATVTKNGAYFADRNLVAGIKLYKGDVYLTIPRWRWNSGQPGTLFKVVTSGDQSYLRPFPDLRSQKVADCGALQYVQSMEIDPNTGRMYVIDTGKTGLFSKTDTPRNLCPAKIVVYDLNRNVLVDIYPFPDSMAYKPGFLNDIVLDYVNNTVRFVYITGASQEKLYVYDLLKRTVYSLDDKSMKPEGNGGPDIKINGKSYTFDVGIDGIAMSSDFRYVYYCSLGGKKLYQIPTVKLREMTSDIDASQIDMGIRNVGTKIAHTDGMAYGKDRLYFGALDWNAVYQWDVKRDMDLQATDEGRVRMNNQSKVVRHDQTMQWVDTFAFDEDGWLWFVSNRLHLFANGIMQFTGADGPNMRIWKVFVNETSYLHGANRRTSSSGFSNRH